MSIDWITVLAQIINLAVLAWLLKKFLYKPVLDMVDQRQALIDSEIQKAQDAAKQAQKDAASYAEQIRLFKAEKHIVELTSSMAVHKPLERLFYCLLR